MINKFLKLGKQHFRASTITLIDEELYINSYDFLQVQKIGTEEYLLEINPIHYKAHSRMKFDIPKDLMAIIDYMLSLDSTILIIKNEMQDITYLPVYKYQMIPDDFGDRYMHEQIYYNNELLSDTKIN